MKKSANRSFADFLKRRGAFHDLHEFDEKGFADFL